MMYQSIEGIKARSTEDVDVRKIKGGESIRNYLTNDSFPDKVLAVDFMRKKESGGGFQKGPLLLILNGKEHDITQVAREYFLDEVNDLAHKLRNHNDRVSEEGRDRLLKDLSRCNMVNDDLCKQIRNLSKELCDKALSIYEAHIAAQGLAKEPREFLLKSATESLHGIIRKHIADLRAL